MKYNNNKCQWRSFAAATAAAEIEVKRHEKNVSEMLQVVLLENRVDRIVGNEVSEMSVQIYL